MSAESKFDRSRYAVNPKKAITEMKSLVVPVKKPPKSEFIRASADPENFMTAYLLEDGVEKVMYLVDPRIAPQQEFDLQIYNLGLGISLQGDAFIWLMRPENETKANTWNQSMAAAFGMAKLKWVRVVSSKEASCYRTIVAKEDFPEPNWPQRTFEEYLDLAFRDRIISDLEHPVLRRLRGEIV